MSASGTDYLGVIGSFMTHQIPLFVFCVVAIVFAFLRRRRCPKAAALAITGLSLMFLSAFVGSIVDGYLIASMQGSGNSPSHALLIATGWVRHLVYLVGLGLIFGAVFVGRHPAPTDDSD